MKAKIKATRWTLYTALMAIGMMLGIYILLGIWPFGDGTVLSGDLNGQYINYFAHYKRAFAGQAGFAYGFDKSLGGSLLGLLAYYVSSPLNFLYLLVPTAYSPVVASFLLLAKVVLASSFFQYFIEKKYTGLAFYGVALGLCYGFMAYGFTYAQNIMWHDVLVLLPLICLGIDSIIHHSKNGVYVVSLAVAIFANFYIAYMACLFAVLYFIYSMLLEKKTLQEWKKSSVVFAGSSLLAGGIPMALLLSALANVSASKGDLFQFQFSFETNFPLHRLPERLLWGNFVWQDVVDGRPEIYCGLLAVMLAGCYFVSKAIPLREKLLSGGLLGFLALSFWVKGLDVIWHGMKAAVWFPYRNSYLFCFVLVLLGARAVAKKAFGPKTFGIVLAGALVLAAGLVIFPGEYGRKKPLLSLVTLLLFAVLLYVLQVSKKKIVPKQWAALALVGVVAVELTASGFYISNQFEKYPFSGFRQFVAQAGGTAGLLQQQEAEPYRVEKNFMRSFNDPMLLDYMGISHFGSTQDDSAVDVLASLGYGNYSSNTYYYGSTLFADSLLGIRYLFDDGSRPLPAHWQESGLATDFPSYRNKDALPLAFAVKGPGEQAIDLGTAENPFVYQNRLYHAVRGGNADLLLPVTFAARDEQGLALENTGAMPVGFTYNAKAEKEGYYYAFIRAEKNAFYGLQMLINREVAGFYFTADNYGVINLGYYKAGEEISLGWSQGEPIGIQDAYFSYLDPAQMEELTKQAQTAAGVFNWQDGKVQGKITGTVETPWLFTSIPYEEGWTATVNGQQVNTAAIGGGLLAVPLQAGENEVLLQYQPRGLYSGLAISIVSLGLFALWQVWQKRKTITIK